MEPKECAVFLAHTQTTDGTADFNFFFELLGTPGTEKEKKISSVGVME
jgi:hypothetical protein